MNDSESRLEKQLRDDAEQRAEHILSRARSATAKALAAVRDEQAKVRAVRLQDAEREAEARARAIAAGTHHEIKRRWLVLREDGIQQLFAEVLPRLETGDGIDRERSLRQLLREALEALAPMAVTVRLSPESAALLTTAAIAEVRAEAWPQADSTARVDCVVDASLRPGVRVESADGRLVFDNTYATRLERLCGPLRSLASSGLNLAESDDDSHA